MTIIEWNEQMTTGLTNVDDQHRHLVDIVNALVQLHRNGATPPDLMPLLNDLRGYTHYHFQTEAELMHAWPVDPVRKHAHLRAHQEFIDRIEQTGRLIATTPADAIDSLLMFLVKWLVHHIGSVDVRLAREIRALRNGNPVAANDEDSDDHSQRDLLIDTVSELYENLSARSLQVFELNQQLRNELEQRKVTEKALRQASCVFTSAREGIMITDRNGGILDVNAAFTRITGYERDEIIGRNASLFQSGRHDQEFYARLWHDLEKKGHWYGEIWNRRKNGEIYAERLTISAVPDTQGEQRQYVAMFSDITAIKDHEQQLEYIAHYDPLTGLPNRRLLGDRLRQAMAQAQRHGQPLALVYLDLDGFKTINDLHGHDTGDKLLIALAASMKQALREGDTLARLGGDEFVAVLPELSDVEACLPILSRLLSAASREVTLAHSNRMIRVSASLGVALYPQSEEVDADQLLRQADQAMYQAKLAGKSRYHFFDVEHDRNLRGHHEAIERIGQALANNEFILYYQPKVNMKSGALIGAEALIRWQHPERGLLTPGSFLPVIEEHPLIITLGNWTLDRALAQIDAWQTTGLNLPVSVNIAARHLQRPDFMDQLRGVLARYPDVPPSLLELEVLETSALEDIRHVSEVIQDCRRLGVSFALDDFGTGYSSLAYLRHLPVQVLKIDQSFVRDMLDDPDDLAILDGVLGLASAFNRLAIAEGVETREHGELLLLLGCEVGQGYGIAHPMPAMDLPGWQAQWQPAASWRSRSSAHRSSLPILYAEVEHRAWVTAVEASLNNRGGEPPELGEHDCRFSQWLAGDIRQHDPELIASLTHLHRSAHDCAAELLAIKATGDVDQATARLGELYGMRDSMIGMLRQLIH